MATIQQSLRLSSILSPEETLDLRYYLRYGNLREDVVAAILRDMVRPERIARKENNRLTKKRLRGYLEYRSKGK